MLTSTHNDFLLSCPNLIASVSIFKDSTCAAKGISVLYCLNFDRFTEDIFAFLISLIFISEPITNLIGVYRAHPLGVDYCAFSNSTGNATAEGNLTAIAIPGEYHFFS